MDLLNAIPDNIFPNENSYTSIDEAQQFLQYQGLTVFHTNIRSLKKNFDQLLVNLESVLDKIDILVCTETFYDKVLPYSFSIPGFEFHHTTQSINQNSGIALFVRSILQINIQQEIIEKANCMRMDIQYNSKLYIILAIYRTGESVSECFIDRLDQYLQTHLLRYNYFLIGDMNINILQDNMTDLGQNYLDTLMTHNFISCIRQPTRDDPERDRISCIDHIMFKPSLPSDIDNVKTAVLHTHITDHYSTIVTITMTDQITHIDDLKTKRFINYELLEQDLSNEHWEDILLCNDVNDAANMFTHKLIN
uniref:Endonuclease/exonuclease/phosphatase domain-containing protein n=1 Tax=Cacopsylla melanoneura TaxID=428564 RepID=A0A8D9DVE6_9HEMI